MPLRLRLTIEEGLLPAPDTRRARLFAVMTGVLVWGLKEVDNAFGCPAMKVGTMDVEEIVAGVR